MATTYQSTDVTTGYGVSARSGIGIVSRTKTHTNTVAYVVNDVIEMIKIPKGATVLDVKLASDDIDGGSNLTLSVGDGSVVDRYIKDSTVGQAGGVAVYGSGVSGAMGNAVNLGYTYTADDTIDVKVTTAPASDGIGSITLTVLYTMDE